MIDVTILTNPALYKLAQAIEAEQRLRTVVKLLDEECNCDRYTCGRCQHLQQLRYSEARDDKDVKAFRGR